MAVSGEGVGAELENGGGWRNRMWAEMKKSEKRRGGV